MGLDRNVWFGNVENGAAAIVGRETVQYVSNIYKYYIAYKLVTREMDATEAARKNYHEMNVSDVFRRLRFIWRGRLGAGGIGALRREISARAHYSASRRTRTAGVQW